MLPGNLSQAFAKLKKKIKTQNVNKEEHGWCIFKGSALHHPFTFDIFKTIVNKKFEKFPQKFTF